METTSEGPIGQHGARQGWFWLRRNGFGVVATEIAVIGSRERPDVIVFRSAESALLEVKASRGDFLADRHKPERSGGAAGLGVYRFYLSPPGVIGPEDLPPRWGLLLAEGGRVCELVRPQGNLWPPFGSGPAEWLAFQHAACQSAERSVLFSIARRLSTEQKGVR